MLLITVPTSTLSCSGTVAHHVISAQGHNLISIENAALFIRHDKPIRVAVQGQPDIRANLPHSGLHGLGIQRPALIVYIQTVRLRAKPENLRAKLFQRQRGYLVIGPVGASR